MPVSIVVGGQFGSEGKGKVALEIARRSQEPVTLVRVGGPNSGHTAYDRTSRRWALRQIPAGAIDLNADVVFPPGSYIDVALLLDEIRQLGYPAHRIHISENAQIITEQHKMWEQSSGMIGGIGSTGAGVGAAVLAAVGRNATNLPLKMTRAKEVEELRSYLTDTIDLLAAKISSGHRVIIEGTQGFGLSLVHSGFWPKVTSRNTTAAGALAEAGISPLEVDDITLVFRAFPIRVAGNSGPLRYETTWAAIANQLGTERDLTELTTVTRKPRRVAEFDFDLAKKAVLANSPNRLVLNHLDYLGPQSRLHDRRSRPRQLIERIEDALGRDITWFGFSPLTVEEWHRETA
jgi:adenylosuccinate synthase